MVDNRFKDYIASALKTGMSENELLSLLEKQGWPKRIISQYLGEEIHENTPIIQIESVNKSFGDNQVLQDLDLNVYNGEILGIIGPSGVGKTTLLNILVGFLEPDSGKVNIRISGEKLITSSNPNDLKKFFGFSTQTPSFYEDLTALENVKYYASLYDIPSGIQEQTSRELIKLVGLEGSENILGRNLSGGMQKRVDIACALVHNPKILILDEPTADLDPILRRQMWDLVKSVNKRGTTVIISSHFLLELESFCDRIGLVHNKKIAQIGGIQKLRKLSGKNYKITIETEKKKYGAILEALKEKTKDFKIISNGDILVLDTATPVKVADSIFHICKNKKEIVLNIEISKPGVKELFEVMEEK